MLIVYKKFTFCDASGHFLSLVGHSLGEAGAFNGRLVLFIFAQLSCAKETLGLIGGFFSRHFLVKPEDKGNIGQDSAAEYGLLKMRNPFAAILMGITLPIPSVAGFQHGFIHLRGRMNVIWLNRGFRSEIFSPEKNCRQCIRIVLPGMSRGKEFGMTRRKKQEGSVRNHIVTVRLDDVEYEMVCTAAERAGLSLSEYFRHHVIFGKVEIKTQIVADFPKLDKISHELSAIGNNLNQLTKYFHMGGLKSQAMTEELTRCINDVMKMRKEVMELGGEYRGHLKTYRKQKR